MYIVLEMQTNETTAVVTNAYESLNVAYQKYYSILSAAAVSEVSVHAAMLVKDDGTMLRTDHFTHEVI